MFVNTRMRMNFLQGFRSGLPTCFKNSIHYTNIARKVAQYHDAVQHIRG